MTTAIKTAREELPMYGFQSNAVVRMRELENILLFDDMGLGKTRQTIEAIKQENLLPALIIPPKGLVLNWEEEILKWFPGENVILWDGDADDIVDAYMDGMVDGKPPWVIMWHDSLVYGVNTNTYEKDEIAEIIFKLGWKSIVVDEAHKFRNDATFKTEALLKFKRKDGQKRFVLTGTPIVNSAMDLYAILKFGGFNVPDEGWVFMERYTQRNGRGKPTGWRNKNELMRIIGNSWIRRTKAQVLKDLPPKTEQRLKLEMLPDQRKAYDQLLTLLMLELEDGGQIVIPQAGAFSALAMMTRLRQLALDPWIIGKKSGSAKTKAILDLVDGHDSKEGKVIVYSNFNRFLHRLKDLLEADRFKCGMITGEMDIQERQRQKNLFQEGDADVLLVNMAAGGEGLNLTAADLVIVADEWWNKVRMNQAIDRSHRIGQLQNLTAITLHVKDSIDDMVSETVEEKDATSKDVMVSMIKHTMETNPGLLEKLGIDPVLRFEESA